MELTLDQKGALNYFRHWLNDQREDLDRCLKQNHDNVYLENHLKSEYFRLQDDLNKIITDFILENYHEFISKDDDGNWMNVKINFDLQEELGFIRLTISFLM